MFRIGTLPPLVRGLIAALPLAALACAALLPAIGVARAEDLPSAESILERYIEVTGGRDAHLKLHSRMLKGTVDIPSAGLKGQVTVWQVSPNLTRTTMEIPGIGPNEEGCNGEVCWESSAMMGARVKEGAEKAQALRLATFHADLEWKALYPSAKTLGLEDVNARPAHKVELTPVEGKPEVRYYDAESGLLVKSEMTVNTQMGDLNVISLVEDYRDVDGIKMPFRTKQSVSVQEMTMVIDEVKHNIDIPASQFELPANVKALVEKAPGRTSSSGSNGTPSEASEKVAEGKESGGKE